MYVQTQSNQRKWFFKETLNPEHQALDPQLSTLNPQPSALNPQPSIALITCPRKRRKVTSGGASQICTSVSKYLYWLRPI